MRRFFDWLGDRGFEAEDFRTNGVMLPASKRAARQCGLPLHAGPHPAYNRNVATAVAMIEARARWATSSDPLGEVRALQRHLRGVLHVRHWGEPRHLDALVVETGLVAAHRFAVSQPTL